MGLEARANNVINFQAPRPTIDGTLALGLMPQPNIRMSDNVVFLEARKKNPLQEQIDYFDQNYREEGLPRDWWNINDVGFSMKSQMGLLEKTGDVNSWVKQVKRDYRGFVLEYLRQGTFFPVGYSIVNGELVDTRYGGRRLLDTVDPNERGGAVRASVSEIQDYLVDGQEGSIAVMVSPPGWTGLRMDNGGIVEYQDTQTFFFQKTGDKVFGGGFRTNFSLQEARMLIKQLTGQDLPASAGVIDCVRAIAKISPDTGSIRSEIDLVGVLEKIKTESRPDEAGYAYQDKTWTEMRRDVHRRQELYEFDERAEEIFNQFEEYILSGKHTRLEMQKAVSAGLLMLSKYFLADKKIHYNRVEQGEVYRVGVMAEARPMTYGQIVEEVQKLPGCAGGGSGTLVTSITERLALQPDQYGARTFECPECHKTNIRPKDQLLSACQHCGSDKVCAPTKGNAIDKKAA